MYFSTALYSCLPGSAKRPASSPLHDSSNEESLSSFKRMHTTRDPSPCHGSRFIFTSPIHLIIYGTYYMLQITSGIQTVWLKGHIAMFIRHWGQRQNFIND